MAVRLCTLLLLFAAAAPAQQPAPRGVHATFERLDGAAVKERDVQRLRLLSFAVERGETPSTFLEPGLFRATLRARVDLPLRDRYRFRVEGRGTVKVSCNGESAVAGVLRAGKPLESPEVRLKKGENELLVTFESLAPGDGELRVFWAGPDFGFEPIAPERLSWPDDDDLRRGAVLRRGHQLFAERHCTRCHLPQTLRIGEAAFGALDVPPPDLRLVGTRHKQDWIAAWLRDPRAFRPDATMPKFRFEKDQDPHDVAAWLASLGAPSPSPEFAADAAEQGKTRFSQLGCVACHTAPDEPRAAAELGNRLPLAHVAAKWHAGALVTFLEDPRRDHAGSRMPDFRLSQDDALHLAAYLTSVATPALPNVRGDADRGRKLVERNDCVLCHTLDVPITERRPRQLRFLKVDRGCLARGGGDGAFDHEFSDEDRHAVGTFLAFSELAPYRRAPLEYVAREVPAQRCTSCHALDGAPSTWALVAERSGQVAPLPKEEDPVAQGVPALTWMGGKLQPSWMTRFVTAQQPSPRPWLTARMPAFHTRGPAIVAGLVREHGYGAADEPQRPPDLIAANHGERLLQMGKGLGCVQCHALGDKPAVQVFERAGIELVTARSRLRHEYFTRWLRDPTRLDPDSRMPKYADAKGRTAITDVLDGDAAEQFQAIWHFLGTKAAQPR